MGESEFAYNFFYVLISFCLIYPPQEFIAAGLTINNLFSRFLGDESIVFIQYHINRICLTVIVHSLIPIMYFVLFYLQFDFNDSHSDVLYYMWATLVFLSTLLPIGAISLIYFWRLNNWSNHPIVKILKKYSNSSQEWTEIASDINTELRRPNKLSMKINSVSKVIATQNWIIKCDLYNTFFSHQSDNVLIADRSDTHQNNITNVNESVQFVTIQVKPIRDKVPDFSIRVNALDFKELQDHINRPIVVLDSVKFQTSVIDMFVEVFRTEVNKNPKYRCNTYLDTCFACMINEPNVKISRNCLDIDDNGLQIPVERRCGNCYCKPMWCVDCLGKWFASRQDHNEKELWLSKKASCPMCRSNFCILDVCILEKDADS